MKIAICTPHHSAVHAKFTASLMAMFAYTNGAAFEFNGRPAKAELNGMMWSGSVLSDLRNSLVKQALDWGADYLLWLDSDHVFPPDTLVRLLSRSLPVVGVNQPRRTTPTYPTTLDKSGQLLWTTKELAEAGVVEEVSRIGLGVTLMDMSILYAVEKAAQARGQRTFWPLFAQAAVPDAMLVTGEDTYFFNLLREAGVKFYVDHALSWEVGHIHEVVLWNADTVAQRDEYLGSLAR